MHIFIINTIFKKTITGGIYYCRVMEIKDGCVKDFTGELSQHFNYHHKSQSLKIYHGSGIGGSRISQHLREMYGNDIKIYDISI